MGKRACSPISQRSTCTNSSVRIKLVEENAFLKEQLEQVKLNLAMHQQKAATTELSMMEAIMQMKEQIQQVMITKTTKLNPEELSSSGMQPERPTQVSQRHEDYLVMSQISRNSFEEEPNHHVPKNKKVKQKHRVDNEQSAASEAQPIRKSTSGHLRQRSETFDFTQATAESVYKKIKIKSPNKRVSQGASGSI